jgi:ABC-type polysaccharide/polyol phosphate transport system ATPase subunit
MAAVIQARGLTKTFRLPHERRTTFKEHFIRPFRRIEYEHNEALRDVSFEIEGGEFFSVIGPNGSGKSTLLKILAGIYRADSGELTIEGQLSPFIELGAGFNPELTARDNVRINATLLGLTKAELEVRYRSIVAFSELERFMDQKLKNFSSGMQIRLAYAIAIQVAFDILLLDEVLAVGDGEFQERCMATFDRFHDEGKTIVFVSHDLSAVRRFSDRVLYIESGRAIALGPAEEVIAEYVDAHGLALAPL